MTKIYDLSDPTRPVFVRDFGLAGQEPGSTAAGAVPPGVHGPIVLGNRVYFAYGTSTDGMLQIVDRQKLLGGPKEPTAANLDAPEISRLYMSPNWGGHTAFPVLGMKIADWASNTKGQVRDFVVLVSEAIANECREFRQASFMIDITTETRPFSVATFQVPEAKGSFCRRGGASARTRAASRSRRSSTARWSSSPTSTAGVRAVDIRDPYAPREAGFYIPATTERTGERCVDRTGHARLQGRDPDQQRRGRRARLDLSGRSRQHGPAHRPPHRRGREDRRRQIAPPRAPC